MYNIYFDENNKMVFNGSNKVHIGNVPPSAPISDGLVFYLDAKDYSGSGNWLDKTPNGYDVSFDNWGNGVRYSTNNDGIFQFNFGPDLGRGHILGTKLNWMNTDYTIMIGTRLVSTTYNGRILSADDVFTSNWLLGCHYCATISFYGNGANFSVPRQNIGDTSWRITTGGRYNSDNTGIYYDNLTSYSVEPSYNVNGPYGLCFGDQGNQGEPTDCEVGFCLGYNRVLSFSEIQYNYNVFKARYGLT